jgi:hypothetical protein
MGRESLSKSVRFDVLKRDNFTCRYCGSSAPDVELEIDHIKPVSRGGTNDIDNLITSCKTCNRGKSNKDLCEIKIFEIENYITIPELKKIFKENFFINRVNNLLNRYGKIIVLEFLDDFQDGLNCKTVSIKNKNPTEVFEKIERGCEFYYHVKDKPYFFELTKIKDIIKNNHIKNTGIELSKYKKDYIISLMDKHFKKYGDINKLNNMALSITNYNDFKYELLSQL